MHTYHDHTEGTRRVDRGHKNVRYRACVPYFSSLSEFSEAGGRKSQNRRGVVGAMCENMFFVRTRAGKV